MTNVRRHARATWAQVMLDYSQPAAVRLENLLMLPAMLAAMLWRRSDYHH